MSRIGKKPIPLPAGVKIKIDATPGPMHVEGPKGKLTVPVPEGITIEQNGNIVDVKRLEISDKVLSSRQWAEFAVSRISIRVSEEKH